jgi:NAD(P)H-flavin reductase
VKVPVSPPTSTFLLQPPSASELRSSSSLLEQAPALLLVSGGTGLAPILQVCEALSYQCMRR